MKIKKFASITLCAALTLSLCACGQKKAAEPIPSPAGATPTAAPTETVKPESEAGLRIGQALGAAHGTMCFTQALAVVKDDVIVAAHIDDYQFVGADSGMAAVPNSDADFSKNYAEGKVLTTKRLVATEYSKVMAEKGGATIPIDQNFDAIQAYAVGKTIAELEAASADPKAVDAITGATLVDTAGYLGVIAQAAKNAQANQATTFTGDADTLKLSVTLGAAHGTACFTSAAALTAGDTIVLCYLDDFQFMNTDMGGEGVPNSDGDFAKNFAEGKILTTKRTIAPIYSKAMAEKGGATKSIDENFDAIQAHVSGMTIDEAAALSQRTDAVDAVSGATLADTAGYVRVIVDAARS